MQGRLSVDRSKSRMKSPVPIRPAQLERLGPFIQWELRCLALAGAVSPSAALRHVFTTLYGEDRSTEEFRLFLGFAAPLARQAAIKVVPADFRIGLGETTVAEWASWLSWLDTFEPIMARIIDLHCFADLSVKETAAVIDLPVKKVVSELRVAMRMFNSRLF